MRKQDFALNGADTADFAPSILQAQQRIPSPLPRITLYTLLALVAIMLVWAVFGRLDIVAVARGKLVPQTFLKIVQPADSGIVKDILVREGDKVAAGQVLIRMDTRLSDSDTKILIYNIKTKRIALRRIDAELSGKSMERHTEDTAELFAQVEAQHRAHRDAYRDALSAERAVLAKARNDLKAAQEVEAKLRKTVPIYREQSEGWERLMKEGYAGKLMALDRRRQYLESEQDLRSQTHAVEGLKAAVIQSEERLAQITSNYRQQLQNERVDVEAQYQKLRQDWEKQQHRSALLELKAPWAGTVKELATHTAGTVVSPGTILLTLVPGDEPLQAEVWIANPDAGFVRPRQPVKIKLAAFPFQQYGMIDGVVRYVSADASDGTEAATPGKSQPASAPLFYRALVELKSASLARDGAHYPLTPGMQLSAEVHLGTRSVIEYLLSPIRKVAYEAGRER